MKKRTLLALSVIATTMISLAAPLTPQQALQRAGNVGMMKKSSSVSYQAVPSLTVNRVDDVPALYIFTGEEGGFLIASADDVAFPVLGYSDTDIIDVNNLPPSLSWWLEEYATQIRYAAENNAPAMTRAESSNREAIGPLMKTQWDQDTPFNNYCPKFGTTTAPTGCVATAMAQVLKYFNYPLKGTGLITYTPTVYGKELSINLDDTIFDWDNMLDFYAKGQYTDAQAEAVATLMKACGYSVNMNYQAASSGASGMRISTALRTYFNIDKAVNSQLRCLYSTEQWENMIYDNLKNVGPVILNGQSPSDGGHSFVIDGYDGNGYYHLNWGWAGVSNGYYLLQALNPDAIGIGGFAGGYNLMQNAILGIQPDKGSAYDPEPENLIMYGNATGRVSNGTLYVSAKDYEDGGWCNPFDHEVTVNLGIRIEPIDGTPGEVVEKAGKLGSNSRITLAVGTYYNNKIDVTVTLPSLADGTYKATVVCRDRKSVTTSMPWNPILVPFGYSNSVILKVDQGKVTVENLPIEKYTMSDLEVLSPLYYGKSVKMKATLVNDTDKDLWQAVCPILTKDGETKFEGGCVLVTVPAKSTIYYDLITGFDRVNNQGAVTKDTEFELSVYNPVSGLSYGSFGTITMKKAPTTTSISVSDIKIIGAETTSVTVGERTYNNVNVVKDKNSFEASLDLNVRLGYMDGVLSAGIYTLVSDNTNETMPVIDEVYSIRPFFASGTEETLSFPISFPAGIDGKLYFLNILYVNGTKQESKGQMPFIFGETGINSIEAETADADFYNLQGMKVETPLPGNIYIRIINGKADKVIVK